MTRTHADHLRSIIMQERYLIETRDQRGMSLKEFRRLQQGSRDRITRARNLIRRLAHRK